MLTHLAGGIATGDEPLNLPIWLALGGTIAFVVPWGCWWVPRPHVGVAPHKVALVILGLVTLAILIPFVAILVMLVGGFGPSTTPTMERRTTVRRGASPSRSGHSRSAMAVRRSRHRGSVLKTDVRPGASAATLDGRMAAPC